MMYSKVLVSFAKLSAITLDVNSCIWNLSLDAGYGRNSTSDREILFITLQRTTTYSNRSFRRGKKLLPFDKDHCWCNVHGGRHVQRRK